MLKLNPDADTALKIAVFDGNIDIVKRLLKTGANPDHIEDKVLVK